MNSSAQVKALSLFSLAYWVVFGAGTYYILRVLRRSAHQLIRPLQIWIAGLGIGYRFMAYAILAIALISLLVWGHHMFVAGQSMHARMIFSILSFLVVIPSAIVAAFAASCWLLVLVSLTFDILSR